jgi:hypothetical protein
LSFADKVGNFFRRGTTEPEPAPAQVAAAEAPKPAPKRESVKSRVQKMVGLRGSNAPEATDTSPARPAAAARPAQEAPKVKTAEAPAAAPAAAPAQPSGVMNGAQPAPSTNSFDSRWSAFR